VSGPRIRHDTQRGPVQTTQVAPTILALLGLDAGALQAVAAEHTATLPGTAGHPGREPGRRTGYLAE